MPETTPPKRMTSLMRNEFGMRSLLSYNGVPGECYTPYQQGLIRALDILYNPAKSDGPINAIGQYLDKDIQRFPPTIPEGYR